MAMFTHDHASKRDAQINPAAEYITAIKLVSNYFEKAPQGGTRDTTEYKAAKAEGFVFCGLARANGKFHAVMVKYPESILESVSQYYGTTVNMVSLSSAAGRPDVTVVFGFKWSDHFSPRVIAGLVNKADLHAHLTSLAGDNEILTDWIYGMSHAN